MNHKVPVSNTTNMPIYVGSTMIPPGEIRHFDRADVPAHLLPAEQAAEAAPEAPPADPVIELQKKPVKDVLAGVDQLTDPQLQQLIDLENAAAKPRASLLEALAALQLERSEAAEKALAAGQGGQS